jgi:hypothetical protein
MSNSNSCCTSDKKKKAKFKVGDRATVVNNTTGQNKVAIGTTGTIMENPGPGWYVLREFPNTRIKASDLAKVTVSFSKETVAAERTKVAAQLALLDAKRAYLEENDLEKDDESKFLVYHTLTLMEDGDLTRKQKADAISAILPCPGTSHVSK